MYQALLTRKYLTSKVMPLLAVAAVSLSVATVLVTWSVMGGFLKTLMSSGRGVIGDVSITWPNVGFAHYEDLIDRLVVEDQIESAAPVIETFGMIQLASGRVDSVLVQGVMPERYHAVTAYDDTLWWRPIERRVKGDDQRRDLRVVGPEPGDTPETQVLKADDRETLGGLLEQGRTLSRQDPATKDDEPGVVMGIHVGGQNQRTSAGIYVPYVSTTFEADGGVGISSNFVPVDGTVGLTLLQLDSAGSPVDAVTRRLPVANEFFTGVYEVDSKTVLVRLDWLQSVLNMDEARRVAQDWDPSQAVPVMDPITGQLRIPDVPIVGIDPARVTSVLVRGADLDGKIADPLAIKELVKSVYADFAAAHPGEVPQGFDIIVQTWEDKNRTLIAAVKKETGVVLFVFGLVCFTTVFLVLAIFWSMVSEKTKDIGVLRSLGASAWGIAGLWLSYGAAIGVVGSGVGTAVGAAVAVNIDAIHTWMSVRLGPWISNQLTMVSRWFGGGPVEIDLTIWDPSVYYFTEVPHDLATHKVVIVASVGVLTCLVGAAWPAARAARMDPVRALRFE